MEAPNHNLDSLVPNLPSILRSEPSTPIKTRPPNTTLTKPTTSKLDWAHPPSSPLHSVPITNSGKSNMTYVNARDKTQQVQERIAEPVALTGGCFCGKLKYTVKLPDVRDAKTSLCHCTNCKKAFGGVFGITVKVHVQTFRYTRESGKPTVHKSDNGAGSNWYREFCNESGSYMCEYSEQAKDHFRNVTIGSLDDPSALSPKGEFYCSQREQWMPQIPGIPQSNGSGEH